MFFYVACSLNIYEWLLIVHRVNFFGGLTSRLDYQWRSRCNRVIYTLVATLVGVVNTTIIVVDAFDPKKGSQLAQVMMITVVFSVLLITFVVVGGILIHRLGAFFKHKYDK